MLDLSLPSLQAILASRTAALDEPVALYEAAARELRPTAPARADFIEAQARGEVADDLFGIYREAWDIPEGLATADDFHRGFLRVFRDEGDPDARRWFFTSPEAFFARSYEFQDGSDTVVLEGDWGDLIRAIFADGKGDVAALVSPAFGAAEFRALRQQLLEQDPALAAELSRISVRRGS
jgi:hypothetical protein